MYGVTCGGNTEVVVSLMVVAMAQLWHFSGTLAALALKRALAICYCPMRHARSPCILCRTLLEDIPPDSFELDQLCAGACDPVGTQQCNPLAHDRQVLCICNPGYYGPRCDQVGTATHDKCMQAGGCSREGQHWDKLSSILQCAFFWAYCLPRGLQHTMPPGRSPILLICGEESA